MTSVETANVGKFSSSNGVRRWLIGGEQEKRQDSRERTKLVNE